MITHKAKYTSNFIPAADLSVGASSLPVDVFVNPGFTGNLLNQANNSTITPVNTITTTGVRYLDTAITTLPTGLGSINLSSGYLWNSVSWSWTNLTLEAWVNMSTFNNQNIGIFDSRSQSNKNFGNAWFVNSSGYTSVFSAPSGFTHNFGGPSVPLNSWAHVAWVHNNGTMTTYVNGVLAGSASTSSLVSSAVEIYLCVDPYTLALTGDKFQGSVFQPMITASAKYTGNFTPAHDLSVGASNVLFFLNPGANGSLADTVSGQIQVGGVVTLASR